jgi:protein-tyrosine phosphatase
MVGWLRSGCLLQITAASGSGYFGRQAKACYWKLLQRNWVHFIATDAHHVEGRLPALSAAYAAIARKMGKDMANRLFVKNPLTAFENAPLPEQPDFQAAES